MKVCFIIPTEPASIGCRALSSYLRSHGYETRLVFVPDLIPVTDQVRYARNVKFECSEKLKQLILEAVQDCDLIGFSVLAQFYEPLADISAFLREKLNCPVVWGGIHATMAPESCLAHADIVSIGDGEDNLLELVNTLSQNGNINNVSGLVFLQNGQTIQTGLRSLEKNLDRYPPLDFSFQEHVWISGIPGKEEARELTPQVYSEVQKKYPRELHGGDILLPYKTVATRGCPYTCSYCSIGSQDKKLFPFRQRSVEHVIAELREVINAYGDLIDVISFSDDTFLVLSEQWITRFCELYTEHIHYPFRVIGHPLNVTAAKVEQLAQAGCIHFGMGVETLSERILYDCYNRKTPVPKVIDAANTLVDVAQRYRLHPPTFDVILGNPYERPADTLETLHHLTSIKSPAQYVRYSLCLFPGSDLYLKALEDGLIEQHEAVVYRSWYTNTPDVAPYINTLYKLITKDKYDLPRWYLRWLATPLAFKIFQACYNLNRTFYQKLFTLANSMVNRVSRWFRLLQSR